MRIDTTLKRVILACLMTLLGASILSSAAMASDCEAVTNVNANLRSAMGSSAPVAVVPKGTRVALDLCFDQGAFCAVKWNDSTGFISGDLLTLSIDGSAVTARSAEQQRWSWLGEPDRGQSHMIVAWGDSLTAGSGGEGQSYTRQAGTLFGCQRDISNQGIGGQNATAIAARMNAIPTLLTLEGNQIPPTGPALVVDRSTTPITNQGSASLAGSLCGISGQLEATTADKGATYSYVFRRSVDGPTVSCAPASPFYFEVGATLQNRIAWLWMGRNGAAPGHRIADDIAAAVSSVQSRKVLVGSILPSANDSAAVLADWTVLNAELRATYGDRFVNLLPVLQAAQDGSAEDAEDVARGVVPRSLRYDAIHLNAKGYAIVARLFHDATLAQGW